MLTGNKKAEKVMQTVTEAAKSIGAFTAVTFVTAVLALAIAVLALFTSRRFRVSHAG